MTLRDKVDRLRMRVEVGATLWLDGVPWTITDRKPPNFVASRKVQTETHARMMRMTGNLADLRWLDREEVWVIPGREGPLPGVAS